jgi:hypothetical protein
LEATSENVRMIVSQGKWLTDSGELIHDYTVKPESCGATIAEGSVTCEKEVGHEGHHMAGITTFWNFDGREMSEKLS